jgi:hypothetical protein
LASFSDTTIRFVGAHRAIATLFERNPSSGGPIFRQIYAYFVTIGHFRALFLTTPHSEFLQFPQITTFAPF